MQNSLGTVAWKDHAAAILEARPVMSNPDSLLSAILSASLFSRAGSWNQSVLYIRSFEDSASLSRYVLGMELDSPFTASLQKDLLTGYVTDAEAVYQRRSWGSWSEGSWMTRIRRKGERARQRREAEAVIRDHVRSCAATLSGSAPTVEAVLCKRVMVDLLTGAWCLASISSPAVVPALVVATAVALDGFVPIDIAIVDNNETLLVY